MVNLDQMMYNIQTTPIPQATKSCLSQPNKLSLNQPSFDRLALGLASLATGQRGLFICPVKVRRQEMTRSNPLKDRKLKDEMFIQGMLWCSKCRQFFPIKDFGPTATDSRNYGYRGHCLRCEKTHKIETTEQRSDYFKKRNNALKAKFIEFAGGRCHRCGYDAFNAALDFHHVYPAQKKYNPTRIVYSGNFEKTWRELDKCCLLCHNCHVTYEAGMWRAEFIKRESLGYIIGAELPLDDNRYETDKPPKLQQSPLPLFTYEPKNLQLALFAGVTL